jgi:hypothetical protein
LPAAVAEAALRRLVLVEVVAVVLAVQVVLPLARQTQVAVVVEYLQLLQVQLVVQV